MKNKPFDLNRWQHCEPVEYRDGKKPLSVYYIRESEGEFKLLSVAWDGSICWHKTNGNFSQQPEHPRDLVMAPKVVEYWLATYLKLNGALDTTSAYVSEESCRRIAMQVTSDENSVQTHKITRYE